MKNAMICTMTAVWKKEAKKVFKVVKETGREGCIFKNIFVNTVNYKVQILCAVEIEIVSTYSTSHRQREIAYYVLWAKSQEDLPAHGQMGGSWHR